MSTERCQHENFAAAVDVNRLTDTGHFLAEIRIRCAECGEHFRFLGLPFGLDYGGAAVSPDGTEARLAIGTDETIANIVDSPMGFTVRRTA